MFSKVKNTANGSFLNVSTICWPSESVGIGCSGIAVGTGNCCATLGNRKALGRLWRPMVTTVKGEEVKKNDRRPRPDIGIQLCSLQYIDCNGRRKRLPSRQSTITGSFGWISVSRVTIAAPISNGYHHGPLQPAVVRFKAFKASLPFFYLPGSSITSSSGLIPYEHTSLHKP